MQYASACGGEGSLHKNRISVVQAGAGTVERVAGCAVDFGYEG